MTRAFNENILIVSHLEEERERIAVILRKAGHGVRSAVSIEEAMDSYSRVAAACVIAESALPGGGGGQIVNLLRAHDPDAVVILLSDSNDLDETVELMKEGAFHVVQKPVQPEQMQAVVAKGLEHGTLSRGHRDLKSQLDINEKLAMIGRLASGVAHELNNPLDGVQRYLRMTKEGLQHELQEGLTPERESLHEYLDRAMSGLSRMTSIVRQLLSFSRNVTIENERENLRGMLTDVVRTLAPSGSAAPVVGLDNPYLDLQVPRAFFQVFVNLIKNALDAVETRGPRGEVRVEVVRNVANVDIRVSDNGVGIAPENVQRVFEPFFTTKEVGRGTGLGLPITARIIERFGGAIRIESEHGKGTTFIVALPKHAAIAAKPPSQGSLQGSALGADER